MSNQELDLSFYNKLKLILRKTALQKRGVFMPLNLSNIGDSFLIKKISGQDKTKRFLANLGFIVGEEISIISKLSGNLIVRVKDSRIALDKEMASKIIV